MIQSPNFQFNDDIPWEDLGDGIKRQVYGHDDKVMLAKVQFESGAIGTPHSHHHTQVTFVESGTFKVTIAGEEKTMAKGDGFYVPPHAVHGCICIEAGMLIDVFSPPREDFIATT